MILIKTKYRIWDKFNKCWDDSGCIYVDMDGNLCLIEERNKSYQTYMHHEVVNGRFEATYFTGLLDSNGTEIFEGDILRGTSYLYGYQLNNGSQFDYFGYVEWGRQCDTGLCWLLSDNGGSWELKQTVHRNLIGRSTGVILGNIYENPALMTQ